LQMTSFRFYHISIILNGRTHAFGRNLEFIRGQKASLDCLSMELVKNPHIHI